MEPNGQSEPATPLLASGPELNWLRAALRSRTGIRRALLLAEVLAPPVAVPLRHYRARTEERSELDPSN